MYNFNIATVDTDAVAFSKPDGTPFTEQERKNLLKELNSLMPECIEWSDDGYYEKCIAVRAKNYILWDGKKKTVKGSAFKNARLEVALKEMLMSFIDLLINDQPQSELVNLYHKYVREVKNIKDISRWCSKRTITDKVMEGERKNETKLKDAIGDDITQQGEKLWVYSTIDGEIQDIAKGKHIFLKNGQPKMIPNRILMQTKYFSGHYDLEHYLERIFKTVEILSTIIDINLFPNYKLKRNKDLLNNL